MIVRHKPHKHHNPKKAINHITNQVAISSVATNSVAISSVVTNSVATSNEAIINKVINKAISPGMRLQWPVSRRVMSKPSSKLAVTSLVNKVAISHASKVVTASRVVAIANKVAIVSRAADIDSKAVTVSMVEDIVNKAVVTASRAVDIVNRVDIVSRVVTSKVAISRVVINKEDSTSVPSANRVDRSLK